MSNNVSGPTGLANIADQDLNDDMARKIIEKEAAAPSSNKGDAIPTLPRNPGIWLFSQPRTASNLFVQMMSGHSNMVNIEYEFFWGAGMPNRGKTDLSKLSEEEKDQMKAQYNNSLYNIVSKVDTAVKEGKRVFAKEHTSMCMDKELEYRITHSGAKDDAASPLSANEIENVLASKRWVLTMPGESEPRPRSSIWMAPDDFLSAWLPVFLIRHPALMIPSQIKVFKNVIGKYDAHFSGLKVAASYRWPRMVYDWYKEHGVPARTQCEEQYQDVWPIILDAEDLITNKPVVDKFCRAAGLNPDEVLYEWPEKSPEEIKKNGIMGHFLSTLMSSSRLKTDLYEQKIDIDAEEKKWVEQFGEDNAKEMRSLTDKAMDDYLYLWERRIKVDS